MTHFSLSKLNRFSHIADFCMPKGECFSPEKLVTNMGLYEGVLIDTFDLKETYDDYHGLDLIQFGVSPDVEVLHRCLNYFGRVMLPCPRCKQQQPCDFKLYSILNKDMDKTGVSTNAPSPVYRCGNNILSMNLEQKGFSFNIDKWRDDCINACLEGIQKLGVLRLEFSCTLNEEHKGFADFVIYKAVDEDARLSDEDFYLHFCLVMEKVGQYPSMADVQLFDIEKYHKVMNKEQFHDFKMAIGLYASGVGCGSFVYLRRILEQLVSETAEDASEKEGWSQEEFQKRRFNEKIDYVENFGTKIIPDSLTSVRDKIYGALSKGVHASSDKECIALFPIMKLIIEELLDHKLEQKEKEERLKQVQKALENMQ